MNERIYNPEMMGQLFYDKVMESYGNQQDAESHDIAEDYRQRAIRRANQENERTFRIMELQEQDRRDEANRADAMRQYDDSMREMATDPDEFEDVTQQVSPLRQIQSNSGTSARTRISTGALAINRRLNDALREGRSIGRSIVDRLRTTVSKNRNNEVRR